MTGRSDIGVVLLQLGTPAAPTPPALRRYLREFLSDRRVVDLPRAFWLPLLHLVILQTRPRKSAHAYRQIWTPDGSPLAVTTARQAAALERKLTSPNGPAVRVVVGMRYGEPSIASAIESLAAAGIERILALPMYPQYAGATTGSSLERLADVTGRLRVVPAIRVVPPYYSDAGYIDALAVTVRESLGALPEQPDVLLASFHGLPQRYAKAGDPYPEHCRVTTDRLAAALGPDAPAIRLTFQSRFGPEPWLQPYTDVTLAELGKTGARVAVMCPGFTADCLETLEEIGLRGAAQFREAGGRVFHRIDCVNAHPAWIDAMASIARRELAGWR